MASFLFLSFNMEFCLSGLQSCVAEPLGCLFPTLFPDLEFQVLKECGPRTKAKGGQFVLCKYSVLCLQKIEVALTVLEKPRILIAAECSRWRREINTP